MTGLLFVRYYGEPPYRLHVSIGIDQGVAKEIHLLNDYNSLFTDDSC